MRKFLILLLGFGLIPAPHAHAAQDYTVPVTENFRPGEVSWSDGYSKAYTFVWGLTVIDGEVAACGAGQYRDPTTMHPSKKMMQKAFVVYDGKKVLTDLSFFTKIPVSADLMQAEATCRKTGIPAASAKGQFGMTIPGGQARF